MVQQRPSNDQVERGGVPARRGGGTARQGHPAAHAPEEQETFYVLEGEAVFHLDGSERALGPGSFVSVPAGVPHAYLVTSEVARALVLITPGGGAMEAFFRDAAEPASEGTLPPQGPLDIERIGAAAARTGAVEILGPPPFAEAGS